MSVLLVRFAEIGLMVNIVVISEKFKVLIIKKQ